MKKILIIEDNLDVRENTAEILELANYHVLTAENGKIGVELAKSENPDLIICDIMMPELDGYGVIHMLSRIPKTSTIPFIFLSAKADKSDIRKGMNLGADDYITKPFDETQLLDAIEIRLKKSERLNHQFSGENGFPKFIEEAKGIAELNDLNIELKSKNYPKKTEIFQEGGFANYLYYIKKGTVKLFKTDDYGKEIVLEIFKENDYFGYLALMENINYTESALAMEDAELIPIPKEVFLNLLQKNREVTNKFIKLLTKNVKEKEERMLKLAYAPVRERAADALFNLLNKTNPIELKVKITREDLANIVGTAPESLIRTLAEFKNDNIIEVQGREILIKNLEKLKKTAGY
jgi:CRP/FNR family transcriptional regulator, polysaccharide utilization system transcription regulator